MFRIIDKKFLLISCLLGLFTFAIFKPIATSAATYSPIVLVTVTYETKTGATVQNASFCGEPLALVKRYKPLANIPAVELWYKQNPKSDPNCPNPSVNFGTIDPGHRITTSTIFHNIDTTTTTSSIERTFEFNSSITGPNPSQINLSGQGPKDSLLVCTYQSYPDGGANVITPQVPSYSLFQEEGNFSGGWRHIMAGLAATPRRTSDSQTMTIGYNTTVSQAWVALCANLRAKPLSAATPSPATPFPTASLPPTPTPITITPPPTTTPTKTPTSTPFPSPIASRLIEIRNNPTNVSINKFFFDGTVENGVRYEETNSKFNLNSVIFTSVGNAQASGGTFAYTTKEQSSGSVLRFQSSATDLRIVTHKCPTCGSFDVYLDGKFYKNYPTYSATLLYKQEVSLNPQITFKSITASSQGTVDVGGATPYTNFIFDGYLENGVTKQENLSGLGYTKGWSQAYSALASGGYYRQGNYAAFLSVTGNTVDLLSAKCPTCGGINIFVNNIYQKTVYTNNKQGTNFQYRIPVELNTPVYPTAPLKQIRLVKKGNSINVDGIMENTTMTQENSHKLTFSTNNLQAASGAWKHIASTSASGGYYMKDIGTTGNEIVFLSSASNIKLVTTGGAAQVEIYVNGVLTKTISVSGVGQHQLVP